MATDPDHEEFIEEDEHDDLARRSIFAAGWFRALLVLTVLAIIVVVSLPYLLNWLEPTPGPPGKPQAKVSEPAAPQPTTPAPSPSDAKPPAPAVSPSPSAPVPPSKAEAPVPPPALPRRRPKPLRPRRWRRRSLRAQRRGSRRSRRGQAAIGSRWALLPKSAMPRHCRNSSRGRFSP